MLKESNDCICMERKIYIRAWFGNWREVSAEKAKAFSRCIIGLWRPRVFARHFKGLTYEELVSLS